jgi:hypothetical protein
MHFTHGSLDVRQIQMPVADGNERTSTSGTDCLRDAIEIVLMASKENSHQIGALYDKFWKNMDRKDVS